MQEGSPEATCHTGGHYPWDLKLGPATRGPNVLPFHHLNN